MNSEQNILINRWRITKEKLDMLKAQELELRNEILTTIFDFTFNCDGATTQKVPLGKAYNLVMSTSVTLSIDDIEGLESALSTMDIGANILTYKPSVSKKAFDCLQDNYKLQLSKFISAKNTQPQLKIVCLNKDK